MNNPNALQALLKPLPYYVCRGFLGNELANNLLAVAVASQGNFEPTKIRSDDVNLSIRVSQRLSSFNGMKELRAELKQRFRTGTERAVAELGLSNFDLSQAKIELELVAHQDGAFYRRHIDTKVDGTSLKSERIITGVYYFHALLKSFNGGELRLYSILPPEQGGLFVDIEPEHDMLLLFPAWAPHEVRPVSVPSGSFAQSRFAINCWFRRRLGA